MSTTCSSCGVTIPSGQGRSCSMCYGDPNYGRDGLYQKWLDDQALAEHIRQQHPQEGHDG